MTARQPARLAARTLCLQLAAAVALVAGCGGGGDAGTSTPAGGSRSFAAGSITGFGSVIVNGVRFDDSTAATTDDDGNAVASSALLLGMQVEVQGGAVGDDGNGHLVARAIAIHFGDQVLGPVTAVDTTAKTLIVLGQNVNVLDTTVIDASLANGLADVTVGMVLEVHGTRDATTGVISATRIQPRTPPVYRVKGPVASLDTTARTFMVGGALIAYGNANPVPPNLANGMIVAVRLQTTQSAGAWVANAVLTARPLVPDSDRADIEGNITSFTSTASFSVNGIPVDASSAQFPEGTTGVVLGAHVEVKGTSSNGTITAATVEVEDHATEHARGFELHGQISAVDTTAKTFVLRGISVDFSGADVVFRDGGAAQIAVGAQVEVKGVLSADGTMLKAFLISFGD